jgi:hypothetical protein
MAQRRKDEERTPSKSSGERPAGEQRGRQPKKPGAGERQRDSQRDTSRSWVHDEPPLKQDDDPQHSGYSDRETPEAGTPESQPGRSSERPRTTR